MAEGDSVPEISRELHDLPDEHRYRLLVDSITDYAIFMLDTSGRVASWNPGAQRFNGYAAAEIIGTHFSKLYTEEDNEAGLPARALATARQEMRFEGEGWRVRKDGTRFWASVVIDPILTSEGQLIGYAKVTRDLTERKHADDLLRKSQEQFRILVEGVSDYAIYMLDPTGVVISWNGGAERIKGYKPREILGQHFSRFYSPEDAAAGLPQMGLATALAEGRFEKEGWRYRKNGERFWANVVIDPIRSSEGELIGFAKITRDMTERREAQLNLERAREAMIQAQKMDAIGQLTGGVAHDFNNLLMAVLGSLELIRKRLPEDSSKLKVLLNNAFEGARRGVALSQRMLSFARRQEMALKRVDVKDLVHGMADLLDRSLGPSIFVELEIPDGLPLIKADPNQMETGLLNLALNARDAMPHGGTIRIVARIAKTDPIMGASALNGHCVVISVIDTGEGMDEVTQQRALEPFFTTKGVGKGTGLGLSMVHGMAEQLGGRVRIQSQKGKGTTIEIWLPIVQGEVIADAEEAAQLPAEGAESRPLVIVVVDDDKLVLVNTTAMLEDFGHTVIEATSGAQALELIRANPHVDLIITDQAMPQMSGMQLIAAIQVEWPQIPVLLVSGYAELPVNPKFPVPKLAKPFSLDDLQEALAKMMSGKAFTEKFQSSYRT
ncbi:MAG TPA: PAS domain S-box protein [Steroidobacteraceae bacterium]|jgi:PAS domain S-box-containing protein|nr:PAS domain S-box protein [Steroidobacteraceae bacterium]